MRQFNLFFLLLNKCMYMLIIIYFINAKNGGGEKSYFNVMHTIIDYNLYI